MPPQRFAKLFSQASAQNKAHALTEDFKQSLRNEPPSGNLVRAMTLEAEEDTDEQWWLEVEKLKAPDAYGSIATDLDLAKQQMVEAWKEVVATFPIDGKVTKRVKHPMDAIAKASESMFGHHIPDEKSQEDEGKMAKFKNTLTDFCQTLDNFSPVFAFFPSDDKYVKILCGVLTTVVQATVQHKKIDEQFTLGLRNIKIEFEYCHKVKEQILANRDMDPSEDETDSKHLGDIQIIIARFFTEVFKFLVPYVRWCTSRFERSKAAINKNYVQDFVEGPLKEIKAQTDHLEREISLKACGNIRYLTAFAKKMEKREATLGAQDDLQQRMDGGLRRPVDNLLLTAGKEGSDLIFHTAIRIVAEQLHLAAHVSEKMQLPTPEDVHSYLDCQKKLDPHLPQGPPNFRAHELKTNHKLTWRAVEQASNHLEVFSEENGYPIEIIEARQSLEGRPRIFERLLNWTMASESELLWLCGPVSNESLSDISLSVAYIVLLSDQAKLPMISYRCRNEELGLCGSRSNSSVAMDRLTVVVYSLIRQLVWLLSDPVETYSDLSAMRFGSLDANFETLLDALNLLDELLALVPNVLICVIDGFQLIDNDTDVFEGTGGYLDVLLDILKKEREGRVLKLLLASDGNCLSLSDERNVGLHEQLHIMSGTSAEQQRSLAELELIG